jgi:hypothetical protein
MRKIKNIAKRFIRHLRMSNNLPPKISSVGILYLCTGLYETFFDQFYQSFEKKFLPGTVKTYFVFSDSGRLQKKYRNHKHITFISIEHQGWPLGTLLRNRYFFQNFQLFQGLDYLFFCNANLICNEVVFLNELGLVNGHDMCGVQHPFFFQKPPTELIVEKKVRCHAYFSAEEIPLLTNYFQGCFYGGTRGAFRQLVNTIYQWTEEDLTSNLMPIWFDESYLNRYFFIHRPYPLHPGFAYPGNATIPFPVKIINIDKQKVAGQYFKRD